MKKLSICLLILLLALGSSSLALADEALTGELTRVTQSVKTTLGIGDSYSNFYGEQMERGYLTTWYLNWSNDEETLTVEADNEGRIISYSRYSYSDSYGSGDFSPIFPQNGREQAQAAADEFLRRVLGAGESIEYQAYIEDALEPREQSEFSFSGVISLNGVASPLSAYIRVDAANMRVSSFWRDTLGQKYLGDIPSPTPTVSAGEAARKLAPQQKFTLAYYRENYASTEARLQYRPVYDGEFYVDAQSGALIDVNKLYEEAAQNPLDRGISGGGMAVTENAQSMATADEAEAVPAPAKLSPVEEQGISQLAGALSREELDAKLRAISELGLDSGYILSEISYGQEQRDSEIFPTANLNYYREADALSLGLSEQALQSLKDEGRKLYIYKYFSVDAYTGELRHFSTNSPYVNELLLTEKKQDFSATVGGFLTKYFGDKYKDTVREENEWDSQDNSYFRYVQQVNGYKFSENQLVVMINPYTGVVEHFGDDWRDGIKFAPATGTISEDKARDLYLDTMECRLAYRALPQAIDPANPAMQVYVDYGYSYLYRLALTYCYEPASPYGTYGIDALSGQALSYEKYSRRDLSYDDTANSSAKTQIEELARYGIGYEGGKFKPTAKLTELDMLMFLTSAAGWPYVSEEDVYSRAYNLGIIERGEQRPNRQISRGEYIKIIISMSGYGKTAGLPGIYACDFADAKDIPAGLIGYAAIAQGLGLVESGPTVSFKAGEIITRAEAAVILYNFMDRKY